jgi:hypothetical protein
MALPPVHSYGTTNILSQWQAGQNRRERREVRAEDKRRFDIGTEMQGKQFDLQQKKFKAQQEEITSQRMYKAAENSLKFMEVGSKHVDKGNVQLGMGMVLKGVEGLNKTYPDLKLNTEEYKKLPDKKAQQELFKQQTLEGVTNLISKGDKKSISQAESFLLVAQNKNLFDKDTMDYATGLVEDARTRQEKATEPPKAGVPTDIDDYVARAREQYKQENDGKEPDPGWLNKKALEFKRAQAPEAGEVESAKLKERAKYADDISYAAEQGKMLAQIRNVPKLIEAKGEITPIASKADASERISGVLAEMAEHYGHLDAKKKIVNVDNTTAENLMASLSASGFGQFAQNIVGTEEQSMRNAIKNSQPLLINYIRQASEMGARGLDSEKELAFYLQAATDPSRDIQSNIAAIVILDSAYGKGEIDDVFRKTLDSKVLRRMKNQGKEIRKADTDGKPKSDSSGMDGFWE